nr:MAG TPA: hypothetical protein [Caudoviricetes sp.]
MYFFTISLKLFKRSILRIYFFSFPAFLFIFFLYF